MSSINKDDKKTWLEYISKFDGYYLKASETNKVNLNKKSFFDNKYKETKSYKKLLKKGLFKIDAIADFHGYNLNDAKFNLTNFVLNSYKSNLKNILVITGKGKNNSGVLRKELPMWLYNKEIKKYIIDYISAPQNLGGDGTLLIRIRTKKN